jgi:hypothetical protein
VTRGRSGRAVLAQEPWAVVRFPAIAEDDEMPEAEADSLLQAGWVRVDAGDRAGTGTQRFEMIAGEPISTVRLTSPPRNRAPRIRAMRESGISPAEIIARAALTGRGSSPFGGENSGQAQSSGR